MSAGSESTDSTPRPNKYERPPVPLCDRPVPELIAEITQARSLIEFNQAELDRRAQAGGVLTVPANRSAPTGSSGQGDQLQNTLFGLDCQTLGSELAASLFSQDFKYGWFQGLNDALGDAVGMQLKSMTTQETAARDVHLTAEAKKAVEEHRKLAEQNGLTIWGSVAFKSSKAHSTLTLIGSMDGGVILQIHPVAGSFTVGLRQALATVAGLSPSARAALLAGRGVQ
jgi:hypothetical protein